ncbi:gliding motility lipoprotein GldD [Pedobacter sp. HMF7647]|uniref:Gliding motility lipoprotein GldD n=1 Tax=Hufsiella arboris TaxID=2695275 RepID=A0A7K1Y616_9SPHI|nr:gliding motility lipoprotein GldD [Hufsiella arboris]MXV49549.1 gliding motility lipoprotein GldD [Hufsiella arboris]
MINKGFSVFLGVLALLVIAACHDNDYSPKPRGYFRIELPKKSYQSYRANCPYTFDFPVYARVVADSSRGAKPCWNDVVFPQFNGRIHLSYQPIISKAEFNELVEDARTFAFKHTVKATSIDEGRISIPKNKVYGIYYTIEGNTASSLQFFLTDSNKHYLRGALYFNEEPRVDSIRPVLDFIKKDVDVMIHTFKWID